MSMIILTVVRKQLFTSKKSTGKSPRLFASGRVWSSNTLVRKATLPFLEQANHVPPASSSLPPKISPPSHHPTGFVGLEQPHKNKKHKPVSQGKSPKHNQSKYITKEKKCMCMPLMIFISVLQEKKRVKRMSLPNKRSYTHFDISVSYQEWNSRVLKARMTNITVTK